MENKKDNFLFEMKQEVVFLKLNSFHNKKTVCFSVPSNILGDF